MLSVFNGRAVSVLGWLWLLAAAAAGATALVHVASGSVPFAYVRSIFVQDLLVDFLFLMVASAGWFVVVRLAGRLLRRRWPTGRVALAAAAGTWVYTVVAVPLNVKWFPGWRSPVSLASNVGAFLGLLAAAVGGAIIAGRIARRVRWPRLARPALGASALIVSLAAAAWVPWQFPPSPAPTPVARGEYNLVIITIDSLRRDFVSCYGVRNGTTPNVDAFAARAVVFDDAYTNSPWTTPAMMTMLTGQYLSRHGCYDALSPPPRLTSLAEILASYGYDTAAVVGNGTMLTPRTGFARGFRSYEYYGGFPGADLFGDTALVQVFKHVRAKVNPAYAVVAFGDTTPWVTEHAVAALTRPEGRRFFLWVHYLDPHYPYLPPPPYRPRSGPDARAADAFLAADAYDFNGYTADHKDVLRTLYGAEVTYVDHDLATFFAALTRAGRWRDTVVVVTADHGEEFFEHGQWGHGVATATQGPSHHAEVTAIPLIIYSPSAAFTPGRVAGTNVSLVDLRPTLLELLALPGEGGGPGSSLVPFMRGAREPARAVFVEGTFLDPTLTSVRRGKYAYVRSGKTGAGALYDVDADRGEVRDVAGADAAAASELRGELERFTAANAGRRGDRPAGSPYAYTADTSALRTLGYLR